MIGQSAEVFVAILVARAGFFLRLRETEEEFLLEKLIGEL